MMYCLFVIRNLLQRFQLRSFLIVQSRLNLFFLLALKNTALCPLGFKFANDITLLTDLSLAGEPPIAFLTQLVKFSSMFFFNRSNLSIQFVHLFCKFLLLVIKLCLFFCMFFPVFCDFFFTFFLLLRFLPCFYFLRNFL